MESKMESRIGKPSIHQNPGRRLHRIMEEPEQTLWQKFYSLSILGATLFIRGQSDPVRPPRRKMRLGTRDASVFRYARIYGDELFLYICLIIVSIVWFCANFSSQALYASNRTFSILMTAFLIVLTVEQWRAIPLR